MKAQKRNIEGAAGAAALRFGIRLVSKKTPEEAEKFGIRLGRVLYAVAKKRRQTCLSNLQLAFPEMPEPERVDLARRVFEHYGIVTADFLRAEKRTDQEILDSIEVEGFEKLATALAKGKGALMITGHLGNWERAAAWVALQGYELLVVARAVRHAELNQLVNSLRARQGTSVVERGQAARPIIEALRKNGVVAILPDQNTDPDIDGIFVPFFGKPAGTVLGPGVIAERTGADAISVVCVRTGPCRYKIIVGDVLVPEPGYERKGEGMIRAVNAALEKVIREYPEQWLWFHDRWKSARQHGLI